METLELFRLEKEQIPIIEVEMTRGEDRFVQKDLETEIVLEDGSRVFLVFDLDYHEDVERGGGIREEPWARLICTSITVANVRIEDESCNVLPISNKGEVERELTNNKIKRKE